MSIDAQYEDYLIELAIFECEDGSDINGNAANYLRSCGICPQCYKALKNQQCTDPECIEGEE